MNNTNHIQCPACGSDDLITLTEEKSHQLTLGGEFNYLETMYKCSVCEEEGDFGNKNDDAYALAEQQALKIQIPLLIESLSSEYKVSMAQFERAFELPQRTLTRWKTGDFSSAGIALLRTVKTFPWLVKVAENKFIRSYAQKTLIQEAARELGSMISTQNGTTLVEIQSAPHGVAMSTTTYIPTVQTQPVLKVVGGL